MKALRILDPLIRRQDDFFGKNNRLWPIRGRKPGVIYETENDYHRLYNIGLKKTQMTDNPMRRMRFYTILQAVRNVANVEGDACEAGCFRGLSAWLAAGEFQRLGRKLTFHICDSFEGLSEASELDAPLFPKKNPQQGGSSKFACDQEQVSANLSEYDFIKYHKGWIPAQFSNLSDLNFCYVHIDVDLYEPTRDSMEFFWPRLNRGGVVLLDDYGTTRYPGARRAIDEYFGKQSNYRLFEQPSGQAIAIKI